MNYMRLDKHSNSKNGVDLLASVIQNGNEHEVQKILHAHPELLRGITSRVEFAFREYRLGADFVADFITGDYKDNGMYLSLSFIELESPKHRLFTANGDPTAALTHALRQIRDWKGWIKTNRAYFSSNIVKTLDYPKWQVEGFLESYVVVIGRRDSMSKDDKRQLTALTEEGIEIMTYDGLIDQYKKRSQYWGEFFESIELIG
jgi:hypothetical protein